MENKFNPRGFVYFLSELAKGLLSRTITIEWASLVIQMVKNPPAMWETWVHSIPGLGRSPKEEEPNGL